MAEIVALRTREAKHFETGVAGVYEARITSGPQHFLDVNDAWQDLSDLVQSVPGGFAATTKGVRFGIENGYLTISRGGKSITMRPSSIAMVDRTAPATRYRKLADASYANVTRDGNSVIVHDIFPQTDLTVKITDEAMSKQFVIRQRPAYPDPISLGWNPATTFLVIVWAVTKPAGAVVRDTETLAVFGNGYVGNHDLVVEDNLGNPVVYFKKGEGWSSRAKATHYPVWYVSLGAQVPFGEAFSYEKASIATYPLTLDPTTTIPAGAGNVGSINQADYPNGLGGDAVAGNSSWSDPGDGKSIPPSSGGGPTRGFMRFNLTSLTGSTCSAASLRGRVPSPLSGNATNHYHRKVPDWSPLDATDWGTTPVSTLATTVPNDTRSYANVIWIGDRWLATGYRQRPSGTYFASTSTDNGATWTEVATFGTAQTSGLFRLNGRTFRASFISADSSIVEGTNNGATWALRQNALFPVRAIAYGGGKYVAVGMRLAADSGLSVSSDGVGWSTTAAPWGSGRTGVGIAHNGTLFLAVADNGLVYTSTNGTAWSASTAPSGATELLDVVWTGSQFVASGTLGTQKVWTSPNGSTWTERLSGVSLRYLSYSSGLVVGTSSDTVGMVYTSSDDGATWTNRTPATINAYPRRVARGGTSRWLSAGVGGMLSSDDGLTWVDTLQQDIATYDAAAVGASFGGWLPVRYESSNEALIETSTIYDAGTGTARLSITYAAGAPSEIYDGPGPTVDAVLRRTVAASLTASAVIKRSQTGTFAANAAIKRTASAGFTVAATIKATLPGGFTASAISKRTTAGTFSADVVFAKGRVGSLTADALLRLLGAGSVSADAITKATRAASITAGAFIQGGGVSAFSADAVLKRTQSHALSAEALVRAVRSATLTADALLRASSTAGMAASAVLRKTSTASFTASAVVLAPRMAGFGADAVFLSPRTQSLTAGAVLRSPRSGSFVAAAYLRAIGTSSLTADAVLKRTRAAAFTADALLRASSTGAITTYALLRSTGTGSLLADAVLWASRSNLVTTDAVLRAPRLETLTTDSIARRTSVATLAVDAFITGASEGSLTIDAVLRRVWSSGVTADAIITTGDAPPTGATIWAETVSSTLAVSFDEVVASSLFAETLSAEMNT